MNDSTKDSPEGCSGRVSIRIPGADNIGEVCLSIRGGLETFFAYSEEPMEVHEPVVVWNYRGGRYVDVVKDPT